MWCQDLLLQAAIWWRQPEPIGDPAGWMDVWVEAYAHIVRLPFSLLMPSDPLGSYGYAVALAVITLLALLRR
jgi:hypothetical protein